MIVENMGGEMKFMNKYGLDISAEYLFLILNIDFKPLKCRILIAKKKKRFSIFRKKT